MRTTIDTEDRIKILFNLTSIKVYDYRTESFDKDQAINITRKIEEMAFTDEELSSVRESDKATILHIAIYSYNAPLVAYYVDIRVDKNKESATKITPIDLIKKLGHLCEGLKDAFNNAQEYLIANKVLEEFESDSDDETSEDLGIIGAFPEPEVT